MSETKQGPTLTKSNSSDDFIEADPSDERSTFSSFYTESDLDLLSQPDSENSATDSASIYLDVNIFGTTTLSDTVITGNLNIGTIQLDPVENSIDAIGTLKIQPMALGIAIPKQTVRICS